MSRRIDLTDGDRDRLARSTAGGRAVDGQLDEPEGGDTDAAILSQIRELAGRLDDESARKIVQNVTEALHLNPQPLPPAWLRAVLEAVALNPQRLPSARPGRGG